MRWRRIPFDVERRDTAPLAWGATVVIAHFLAQAVALQYTTATNTAWIITVTPLAIAALSALFLRESIGKNHIVGIIIATIGVLLLVSRGDFGSLGGIHNVGDFLVLFSAHTWALYTIITRPVSARRQPLAVTLVIFTPLALVCMVVAAASGELRHVFSWSPKTYIALLFIATLGTLAQWFWQEAVARLGAARMGMYLYFEPIATTALAVPLMHEPYGVVGVIGSALVLLGVWRSQKIPNAGQ